NTANSCIATGNDTVVPTSALPSTVQFFADGSLTAFASCSISGSAAVQTCSVNYTPTTVGPHTVVAKYSGDASHSDSTSAAFAVAAEKRSEERRVGRDPPTVPVNTPTSCTATVSDAVPTTTFASGTGQFVADASLSAFASCSISGSAAVQTCSVNYTPTTVGPHTVVAKYSGDASHSDSTSAAFAVAAEK